mgnify:CR=1 FL=1
MNGQHLRSLPEDDMRSMVGGRWVGSGLLASADSPFTTAALAMVQNSLELVAGEVGRGRGSAGCCGNKGPAQRSSREVYSSRRHSRKWRTVGSGCAVRRRRTLPLALPCPYLTPASLTCPSADCDRELRALLTYPLAETLASDGAKVGTTGAGRRLLCLSKIDTRSQCCQPAALLL